MSAQEDSGWFPNARWAITSPFSASPDDPDVLAAACDTEVGAPAADELASGAAVVVKRGFNAGSRFPLDRAVTAAGRHPDSHIFLDGITVSRRHAEFRMENGGVRIIDIGSLNGTYVNRKPVQAAMLRSGDEIQIGGFRLVFLTGDAGSGDR